MFSSFMTFLCMQVWNGCEILTYVSKRQWRHDLPTLLRNSYVTTGFRWLWGSYHIVPDCYTYFTILHCSKYDGRYRVSSDSEDHITCTCNKINTIHWVSQGVRMRAEMGSIAISTFWPLPGIDRCLLVCSSLFSTNSSSFWVKDHNCCNML